MLNIWSDISKLSSEVYDYIHNIKGEYLIWKLCFPFVRVSDKMCFKECDIIVSFKSLFHAPCGVLGLSQYSLYRWETLMWTFYSYHVWPFLTISSSVSIYFLYKLLLVVLSSLCCKRIYIYTKNNEFCTVQKHWQITYGTSSIFRKCLFRIIVYMYSTSNYKVIGNVLI